MAIYPMTPLKIPKAFQTGLLQDGQNCIRTTEAAALSWSGPALLARIGGPHESKAQRNTRNLRPCERPTLRLPRLRCGVRWQACANSWRFGAHRPVGGRSCMMAAVRAPQSQPATMALSMLRASINVVAFRIASSSDELSPIAITWVADSMRGAGIEV